MFSYFNVNPGGKRVGDCTVRAISAALNQSWDETFIGLALKAADMHDMPSANEVWSTYLKDKGLTRKTIPDTCPYCYSVSAFAKDHKNGVYIVACDGHVTCVIDGNIRDTWDCSDKTAYFYWEVSNV